MDVSQNSRMDLGARDYFHQSRSLLARIERQRAKQRRQELVSNILFAVVGLCAAACVFYLVSREGAIFGESADFARAFKELLNR